MQTLAAVFCLIPMEYKTLPQFTKQIDGRAVTGIFAVHGNIDSGMDMSVPGSFAKRLLDATRKRARFLWNHNAMNPPIATIKSVREVGREELPAKVLQYAPGATGGVEVTREYYNGIPLADWVLAGIQAGDIDEMSYAYDVHEEEMQTIDGKRIRILKDVELFDISDVNWGMNPATAGVKGLSVFGGLGSGLPFEKLGFSDHSEAVVSVVEEFLKRAHERAEFRAKEGRVLSAANQERLGRLLAALQEVSTDLSGLLASVLPQDPEKNRKEALAAWVEFQTIMAKTNGVSL